MATFCIEIMPTLLHKAYHVDPKQAAAIGKDVLSYSAQGGDDGR